VFIRLVTAIANSKTLVAVQPEDDSSPALKREAKLINDIQRFTKAGSAIAMAQHRDVIARLEVSRRVIQERGLNTLALSPQAGGLGVIAGGIVAAYLEESLDLLVPHGFLRDEVSVLKVAAVNPIPVEEIQALLMHVGTVLVLEELEPYLEREVYVQAYRSGVRHRIIGKLDGFYSRVGEYGIREVTRGIAEGLSLSIPPDLFEGRGAEALAAPRPITVCAGCPHRGTYMAINQALRKLRYKKDEVMVTGDIGCTILGMNPPFNTIWNEISMGASVALAQGFVHAGVKTPVIATIGDSTFFHAGIPGLVNAIQHQVDLTLIIMDNGWTAMTGMQINPGTAEDYQKADDRSIDIANVIPGLGIEHFFRMDPFDYPGSTSIIQQALALPGVKVILARRECAIQTQRRGESLGRAVVDMDKCALCKLCINLTGCPALSIEDGIFLVDTTLCNGCGLCVATCNLDALHVEAAA
jgi:indolepyruvate ferredoxin oxidoreductase alpha subunit